MDVLMMDVDGVLVRGRPQDGLPFATDLEKDLGLNLELWQRRFFKPNWAEIVTGQAPLTERLAGVLAEIAPTLDVETLVEYWFRNDSRIDQGVLESLAAYRARDIKVFLATNQEHRRADYLMNDLGLADHVDGIFYSADLGYRKPSAEFYQLATQRIGAAPDRIVLVDDTLENIEGAKAFGWAAVHWTGEIGLEQALAPYART